MKFAPQKYELIHFTRSRTRFNLKAGIRFNDEIKTPASEVRVLGVWLDTKLKWSAHIRKTVQKGAIQTGALTRLGASTWGASFMRSRQIYSAVIRPQLAYAAAVWHSPWEKTSSKIKSTQNKCLRTIAGAFKATPIPTLEAETFIPPIDLYMNGRVVAF